MYERKPNTTVYILEWVCREKIYLNIKCKNARFQFSKGGPLENAEFYLPRTGPNLNVQQTPTKYRYLLKLALKC